jgi:hypothetical protein
MTDRRRESNGDLSGSDDDESQKEKEKAKKMVDDVNIEGLRLMEKWKLIEEEAKAEHRARNMARQVNMGN